MFWPPERGCSPLTEAANLGDLDRVRRLLADDSDPAHAEFLGPALVKAAAGGHVAVIDAIFADARVDPAGRRAPVYYFDHEWALQAACNNGHAAVVERLLPLPLLHVSVSKNTLVLGAFECGHVAVVAKLLANKRFDPTAGEGIVLAKAVEGGHAAVVDLLLADPRVDPSAGHNWPLTFAVQNQHAALVERLLADARVLACDCSAALVKAAEAGDELLVLRLLANGRLSGGGPALAAAAGHGHQCIVELLLDFPGVSKLCPRSDGTRALAAAASGGHIAVVQRLLQLPEVDPTPDSPAALSEAAFAGHADIVELLLADPRTVLRSSVLGYAAAGGHVGIMQRLLLDARIDPAASQNLAVSKAARGGHVAALEILLADPRVDASDFDNHAIRVAAMGGHIDVVELLLAVELVATRLCDAAEGKDGSPERRLNWDEDTPLQLFARIVRMLAKHARALPIELVRSCVREPAMHVASLQTIRGGISAAEVASSVWQRRRAAVLARAIALARPESA